MAGGRPTKYKPEYVKVAQAMSKLGATDVQVAAELGVALSTMSLWRVKYPEFSVALNIAKEVADENVVKALYHRATGYSITETDIRVIDRKIVTTDVIRHYPPDVTAIIYWLKNRRPDLWRDRPEGNDGDRLADMLRMLIEKQPS